MKTKNFLSWQNLLVILLASMFLGAGLRTSKDAYILLWAIFVDIFSFFVLALLIVTICREAIKKYRGIKGGGKLEEKKIDISPADSLFKKPAGSNKRKLRQLIVFFKKYLPDTLLIGGISILSYLLFRPVAKNATDEMLLKYGLLNPHSYTGYKVLGVVLIALAINIAIRRYFKNKQ